MIGRGTMRRVLIAFVTLLVVAVFGFQENTVVTQISESPGATFTVTSNADSGAGSLRQAITDANAAAGTDTINFAIGTGAVAIETFSALPDITGPVVIDGTTQPGFSGTPLVDVRNFGLKITGGGTTLKGLAVSLGNGVVIQTGGGNSVIGCRLSGLTDGVLIDNSPNNQIGGSTAADANNIGSNNYGVRIAGAASTGNIVIGNFIGLNSDGTDGRNTLVGVAIEGAPNNRIGGTTAGERNIISNNGGGSTGSFNLFRGNVLIIGAGATGNVVQGNYIGTNIAGTAEGSLSTNGNRHNGVRIEDAPNNTVGGTVGTTPGGACTGACNLISGNKTNSGVYITGSGATGNMILGNFIGTNVAGTAVVSNPKGVVVTGGASSNTIGSGTAAGRNIISGAIGGLEDSDGGITLDGNFNTVQGNYIGTDTTGSQVLSNNPNGILISGTDNIIGTAAGTTHGGACTGGCNLITPAGGPGIKIIGTTNPIGRNIVDYNYIGLNAAGTEALLGVNFPGAIWIVDSDQNTIGHLPAPETSMHERTIPEAPEATYCIQDANTGDYVVIDDQSGFFEWKICRSGQSGSGTGIVSPVLNTVFFNGTDGDGTRINGFVDLFVETASASIGREESGVFHKVVIKDGQVNSSSCECPSQGRQTLVSGFYSRGLLGSSDTIISNNDINQPANDPFSDLTPGNSSAINNDRGSHSLFVSNNISGTSSSPVVIGDGTNSPISKNRFYVRYNPFQQPEAPTVDLNNDGRDTNDPLDADGGANSTLNYPTNLILERPSPDTLRLQAQYHGLPNGSFNIALSGRQVSEENGEQIVQTEPTGITFPINTDTNGHAAIDQTFTGIDAFAIGLFDQIVAAATVITPEVEAGNTSEFSDPVAVPPAGPTPIPTPTPTGTPVVSTSYVR